MTWKCPVCGDPENLDDSKGTGSGLEKLVLG
jgi:hypothetical protein